MQTERPLKWALLIGALVSPWAGRRIDTGDGRAIASYGPLVAQGRWVLRLKHWIDRRWIAKYAALANGR